MMETMVLEFAFKFTVYSSVRVEEFKKSSPKVSQEVSKKATQQIMCLLTCSGSDANRMLIG